MNRKFQEYAFVAVFAFGSLACSAMARATTIAEWDFRVDEDLTIAGNGASTNATLQGGATINTGAALPGSLTTNPKLLNGSLNALRAGGAPNDEGISTTATWGQLFGTNNLTSGTFIGVFKPTLSAFQRYTLLSHAVQTDAAGQVWAVIEQNSTNTQTDVRLRVGAAASDAAAIISSLSNSNWYFFAGSWSPGQNVTMYLRDITTGTLRTFTSGSTTVSMNPGVMTDSVYLGIRKNGFSPFALSENANSLFAFAQMTNDYVSTQTAFDALYTNLITPVPEPSSIILTVIGFTTLFTRCRRYGR